MWARRALALVVVLAVSAPASADPATQTAMEDYFAGEQRGGYVLVGMGAAGLAAGGLLYAEGSERAKGASYPLLGLGLAHLAAGIFIKLSSSRRVDAFGDQIASDAAAFRVAERKRMTGVSTQFLILKITWVVVIAGGLTMAGIARETDRPRLEGAGYALAGEAAATLVFDFVAARRAHRYRARLAVGVGADVSGAPIGLLVHRGTF